MSKKLLRVPDPTGVMAPTYYNPDHIVSMQQIGNDVEVRVSDRRILRVPGQVRDTLLAAFGEGISGRSVHPPESEESDGNERSVDDE